MKYHAASEEFPMMDEQGLRQLGFSLREQGFRPEFPIITYQNEILDGRNRLVAAKAEGIEPIFKEYDGVTPWTFVLSANAHRRHLPIKEKMRIVEKMLPKIREEAKARSGGGANLPPLQTPKNTGKTVGELLGVSERTADSVVKVFEHGSPEVIEAMKNGEVKPSDAAKIIDEPKREQTKAVRRVKAGKASNLQKAIASEKDDADSNGQIIDEVGKTIPESLIPVFSKVKEFRACLNQVNEIKRMIKELGESPAGIYCNVDNVIIQFDNAKRGIKFAIPYAVCPVCNHEAKQRTKKRFKEIGVEWELCACKESGWVTEEMYKRLPAEVRA